MEFSEIEYTPAQKDFLAYLKSIGCVVDTVILQSDTWPVDIASCAKAAALKGMEILAERYVALFKKLNPARDIRNYFHIKIHAHENPKGTPVSYAQFLGEYPDGETNNMYVISDDINGLGYALICPPYNLSDKIGFNSKREFYDDVLQKYQQHLLGVTREKDTQALVITAWSTDWSNYFDAGKEWWGTFCWTVYDPRTHNMVFIAASSTD